MSRILLLGVAAALLTVVLGRGPGALAQTSAHAFRGTPTTDFLLDGSELTLPFLLVAEAPDGAVLTTAVVDPCCQWSIDVPAPAGTAQVIFVLSEPNDPTRRRGVAEGLPLQPGGTTLLTTLAFSSQAPPRAEQFIEIPPVVGIAGQGQLLDVPPVPTPEQILRREQGLSVANPEQTDTNFTVATVAPPAVSATVENLEPDPVDVAQAAGGQGGCGDYTTTLAPGFNAVGWTGGDVAVVDAAAGYTDAQAGGQLPTTFVYDPASQRFLRNDPRLPRSLAGFARFNDVQALWIQVENPAGATWTIPVASNEERTLALRTGWNFAVWTGPAAAPPVAFASLRDSLVAAFSWDAASQRMRGFRFSAPAAINTMPVLGYGTAVWLQVSRPVQWLVPPGELDCAAAAGLPAFPDDAGLVVQSAGELGVAAAGDFQVFRSSEVLEGTNTSRIGEPIAANDRSAILYTGNWHAALSVDNGVSWQYIDPDNNGFPTPSAGGAMCCDQLTWFDNDSGQLFWLLQTLRDTDGNNSVRVVVYQNKTDLEQQAYCIYDFSPQTFGATDSRWFDFNNMKTTDRWLYITANRYRYIASSNSSSSEGGYVWRMELEDFSGACGAVTTQYYYNDAYYGIPLAPGGSTIYWAVHEGSANDALRIGRATDSSTTITHSVREISPFPSTNRGDAVCTAPDGTNPCARFGRRILTGWTGNGQVGFMWNAAQDASAGWAMPHTRVAIFRTSDLTLTREPHVWNSNYAWVMPTVSANSRGDIAGPIYLMGGGSYPKAKAIIWDADSGTPAPWENHTLRSGNDAPEGKGSAEESVGRFGDYGGSIPYDNCRATWLVAFYVMRDGGTDDDAEHRMAWIGRERDACADLTVSALAFAVISGSNPQQLLIAETTRNIGGGSAGASSTRYYLSRDQEQGAGDVLLDATHAVPGLGALDSDGLLELATVPAGTPAGQYYVLVCADDLDVVTEITVTNNCRASESTLTISLTLVEIGPIIVPFRPPGA